MTKSFSTPKNKLFNPILTGLICGFYPLVFYYSNNFWAINSWSHFGYFLLVFIGIPIVFFGILSLILKKAKSLSKYKTQILFVSVIMVVAVLLSQAMSLKMEKKILLGVLILSGLLAWKFHEHWKKLLVLLLIMSVIPTVKNLSKIVEFNLQNEWMSGNDSKKSILFKNHPNIYIIQPDGYAAPEVMSEVPYSFENPFYDWLKQEDFTIYPNYRSNYPASLSSNAALFSMRQHKFGKTISPAIEIPRGRDVISGKNQALEILKNNGYSTFFIVEDEYFQQNRPKPFYDYYNISFSEIPFFSDNNSVKKSVFTDLKAAMDTVSLPNPKFYFVEKLLPHHISFSASKEEERDQYIEKIKEVNDWLKTTLDYISEKDPKAIVIVLADHGGWVGINSYREMFSTYDETQLKSVFSSLAAVKWNGHLKDKSDSELKSSVNLFRVLFSVLSENSEYLKYTEDNSSYILREGSFTKSVEAVIDNEGKIKTP